MRLHGFLIGTFCLFAFNGFAQQQGFGWNPGVNSKLALSQSSVQFESKFSVKLLQGLDVQMPGIGKVKIQSELLYSMFGRSMVDNNTREKYKAYYLFLPVITRWKVNEKLSAFAGPQFGILVNGKVNMSEGQLPEMHELRKTNLQLTAGIEYKCRKGISWGFRYHHGWPSEVKDDSMPLKNHGWSLAASYHARPANRHIWRGLFR